MTQDYHARKISKKYNKANSLQNNESQKRNRSRVKKRKVTKSLCYQQPSLTQEDKGWISEQELKLDPGIKQKQQAKLAELKDLQEKQQSLKKRKRSKDNNNAVNNNNRFSTSTSLMDPSKSINKSRHNRFQQNGETFSNYPSVVKSFMERQGFLQPTKVQFDCWGECINGGSCCVIAPTGAGKTHAYLVPILVKLENLKEKMACDLDLENKPQIENRQACPNVLIMAPTRELVIQIGQTFQKLESLYGYKIAALYGGVPDKQWVKSLQQNPDVSIIIGAPGTLVSLLENKTISLDKLDTFVVDEVDKMVEQGLEPQLKQILNHVPSKDSTITNNLQVLLFSATLGSNSRSKIESMFSNLKFILSDEEEIEISPTVTQVIQVCSEHKKPAKLMKHVAEIQKIAKDMRNKPRLLIFANHIKTVQSIYKQLLEQNMKVTQLHGDMKQKDRTVAFEDFRAGKIQVMVCTDVLARGLNIKNLPYVVNYDFPTNLSTYIHRIGRVGRLSSHGHTFSFFTRNLQNLAKPLVDLLVSCKQSVDPNLYRLCNDQPIIDEQEALETPQIDQNTKPKGKQSKFKDKLKVNNTTQKNAELHKSESPQRNQHQDDMQEKLNKVVQQEFTKQYRKQMQQFKSLDIRQQNQENELSDSQNNDSDVSEDIEVKETKTQSIEQSSPQAQKQKIKVKNQSTDALIQSKRNDNKQTPIQDQNGLDQGQNLSQNYIEDPIQKALNNAILKRQQQDGQGKVLKLKKHKKPKQ